MSKVLRAICLAVNDWDALILLYVFLTIPDVKVKVSRLYIRQASSSISYTISNMGRMSPDARSEQDGAAGKRDYTIRGKLSGKILFSELSYRTEFPD